MILAVAIWLLTAYAWGAAFVLFRVAARHPRLGPLLERTIVAFMLALFGTGYSLVLFNTEVHRVVSFDDTVIVVRTLVIALLCIPAVWSWMFVTGRLTRLDDDV